MMGLTGEGLADMVIAARLVPLDPPPREAQIDAALDGIAIPLRVPADVRAEARNLLHARFRIRMDLGDTLVGAEEHVRWLDGRRSAITPFYWKRYRDLLLKGGWSPLVAATLDRSTDDLLELLGDPAASGEWKRRGLVVGDVQSGKTASYAALICKAADAGYRMIVLLTGTLENVRRQTQERLDAAFVGFDSRDSLGDGLKHRRHIGAGLLDPSRNGIVFTSRDRDFRKDANITLSLQAVREPVLVVAKKNKGVLTRLSNWLRVHNAEGDGKIGLPLLLVDDEADNASINTRQGPNETTAINRGIRDLLALFRSSSYVGFTATPFANIFIDPASHDEMLKDDLFPNDFIHVLQAPTNYVGMASLFPRLDPEEVQPDASDSDMFLRPADDALDWLPPTHRKHAEPEGLPESMEEALNCFLLACAIRDLRAIAAEPGAGGGLHRSMLVNVSRFTAVQDRVAALMHVRLDDIRAAVRLHGKLSPAKAAQSAEIRELEATFTREYARCGHGWAAVLDALHEAIAPVRVQPVNQRTGAASLDYASVNSPPGVRVIAVGGDSLSRGLTLEGLSVSYFLRNPKAYDTLLQMGRWFGYREGYRDLCRLWLTEEADGWYRHVADATAELKRDFARMKRRKATPREFGLRVRTHPDTLIITARNKMATGMDVVGERELSFLGKPIETSRLPSDRQRNEENRLIVERFTARLAIDHGPARASPHRGAMLWTDVPASAIADFLDAFLVHPRNYHFQAEAMTAFLRRAAEDGDPLMGRWTVGVLTTGEVTPAVALPGLPDVELQPKRRLVRLNRDDGSLLVSGKSSRVGSPRDIWHGLTIEALQRARQANQSAGDYRAEMACPLLLIYLIVGKEVLPGGDSDGTPYKNGLLLPALGLHFPDAADTAAPRHLVSYRLNRVAQEELLPEDGDEGLDEADADD